MLHQTRIQHLAEGLEGMKDPPLNVAKLGEGEYVLIVDGEKLKDEMDMVRLLTWDWTMANKGFIVPEDCGQVKKGQVAT